MNTNVRHESTEYTEETECLADVGHIADDTIFKYDVFMKMIKLASVCSAVCHRFAKRK